MLIFYLGFYVILDILFGVLFKLGLIVIRGESCLNLTISLSSMVENQWLRLELGLSFLYISIIKVR